MGNCRAAEIRIGGRLILRQALDALLVALRDEGASTQWSGSRFAPSCWHELEAALADDGTLFLCNTETRWGEFETLEATCVDLRLVFVRKSEATRKLDSETAFSSGDGPVTRITTGAGDQPIIKAETLRDLLVDADTDPETAILEIGALLSPSPPKVPPLELALESLGTGADGTGSDVRHYLLVLHGGLEPSLQGPFADGISTEAGILRELRENAQLLAEDGRDTACRLTVTTPEGTQPIVTVGTYAGHYMDELRRQVRERQQD